MPLKVISFLIVSFIKMINFLNGQEQIKVFKVPVVQATNFLFALYENLLKTFCCSNKLSGYTALSRDGRIVNILLKKSTCWYCLKTKNQRALYYNQQPC